jgi:uncharacterized protein
MSEKVARKAATRIREHLNAHGKHDGNIIFHGGEPLLGGRKHLTMLISIIAETFTDSGINISIGMQSNGILFTHEIGELLIKRRISIGISIDGPPKFNDLYRVDREGHPTSKKLEKVLEILTSYQYRNIFSGFLCVINIETDPIEVIKYLLHYNPSTIDFLFPLDNYNHRPIGKQLDNNATPYGEWLIKIFDYYWHAQPETRIRIFDSIVHQLFGGASHIESFGLDPVDLIVIETNGDIEAVDSLKTTYNGATKLGYNIFKHDFNTVSSNFRVISRQLGAESLCKECRSCPLVSICGGGYLPHRYSIEHGFDNPSVYCTDLQKLIRHIYSTTWNELQNMKSDHIE